MEKEMAVWVPEANMEVKLEHGILFNRRLVDERVLAYVGQGNERLNRERRSLQCVLSSAHAGAMIMMMRLIIIKQIKQINQKIRLKRCRLTTTAIFESAFTTLLLSCSGRTQPGFLLTQASWNLLNLAFLHCRRTDIRLSWPRFLHSAQQ